MARQVSVSRFIIIFEVLAVQKNDEKYQVRRKDPRGLIQPREESSALRLIFWRNPLAGNKHGATCCTVYC